MTINEALGRTVDLIGDSSDVSRFKYWLSEIESTICSEIGATHEGNASDMSPIGPDTDGDRVLFVPDPDSQLYILFLLMKNDFYLQDAEQYANSAAAFEAAYASFADKYNREHMPRGEGKICL